MTIKYCWLETRDDANLNCETLSTELGINVKEVTMGGLVVGEIDDIGEDGKSYKREIIRKGVEIEFENEPTAEQLEKIDVIFKPLNLKRTDGITTDAHWAIVDSFHPTSEKPLRVTRRNRLIDCYVTQAVVTLYLAGQLNVGDMVVGIFVDGDIDKPLIVDKIYRP